jgi:hypothetical protein
MENHKGKYTEITAPGKKNGTRLGTWLNIKIN